jgi:hypothetical protein
LNVPQAGNFGEAVQRYSSALRYVGQSGFTDADAVTEEQKSALQQAVTSCLLNRCGSPACGNPLTRRLTRG